LRKIGGILLAVGLGILIGWGLYWFLRLAFLELPLPVKIAIAAIAVGLIILLASLGWERYRASKEEKKKSKEVEK
jgi:ABC-type antimicrobial peptide transport system permease subunit